MFQHNPRRRDDGEFNSPRHFPRISKKRSQTGLSLPLSPPSWSAVSWSDALSHGLTENFELLGIHRVPPSTKFSTSICAELYAEFPSLSSSKFYSWKIFIRDANYHTCVCHSVHLTSLTSMLSCSFVLLMKLTGTGVLTPMASANQWFPPKTTSSSRNLQKMINSLRKNPS